ncbi:glycosyltransferase family 4 protein [Clostridium perfringens]|uniref:glycosyltransferase family 4 protein n=1 Tax=Clostridium perfringens TaxID=1502 RepID=UPI0023F979FC|nr:glycosyltransferase [Clostridium perfringens]WEV22674.1 glycosyltransferase [Clostridium perfringens D]
MKVLWLVNIPLPEASVLMNKESTPLGGWLINASKDLAEQKDIELTILFPESSVKNFVKLKGEKITYYAFKEIKDNKKQEIEDNNILNNIINEVNPDIVHIYGTELPHTLAMVNACKMTNTEVVISIQGLVSIYSEHVIANLPLNVIYGFTLRNLLMRDNVIGLKNILKKRGVSEIKSIQKVNHIIGRTSWDKACIKNINKNVEYHFCNETLREEFYKYKWDISKCEKHSIFLSQGQTPIKGLHYVIKSMPILLKEFPDAKLYVSGKNIIKSDKLKEKLMITYYGKYIKRLIKKLNLESKVIFTGPLDEKNMCKRYLKSNVFICPSSIENSPNSLGEAMILGVPCVASDVGGVADIIEHKKEGFVYQSDAYYMIAYYIGEIFRNKNIALNFSKNAREHAIKTHNREINTTNTINIYKEILGQF